jgi:hypothetical protein
MKKIYSKLYHPLLIALLLIIISSCEFRETDFGYNGTIKGSVKDSNGNIIFSDVLVNNVVVNLLGDGDMQSIIVRVKGDGTFQNTKIFPKKHKIWVSGPVFPSDTVYNDFSATVSMEKDFVVVPFISPNISNATVSGTSINVSYSIAVNPGKTHNKSEIYCSTAAYPTAAIGTSAPFYSTKTVALTALSGNASITGLTSGQKYYVRIGSLANGTTLMNYSNQIILTIP